MRTLEATNTGLDDNTWWATPEIQVCFWKKYIEELRERNLLPAEDVKKIETAKTAMPHCPSCVNTPEC